MRIVHSIDELVEALREGDDAADLTMDDGVWRQNPDRDRAADPAPYRDHMNLLRTGGKIDFS